MKRRTPVPDKPARARRAGQRGSDWNKNFDLHKAPKIWQAAKVSLFRAPGQAFSRHAESKAPMCPSISENLARIYRIPVGSGPDYEARRKETRLPIVAMSSGRLFLDRVGRHHCPSPLHRHSQTNMHFPKGQDKGDISTLPAGGHFYFALTRDNFQLTNLVRSYTVTRKVGGCLVSYASRHKGQVVRFDRSPLRPAGRGNRSDPCRIVSWEI